MTPASLPVVLDTNVWLDWLVFDDPGVVPLIEAVRAGEIRPLGCGALRDELADVLARPRLQVHVDRAHRRRGLPARAIDVARSLARFDALAQPCEPPPACRLICRDPDDQVFLDLAVAAGARWLLTKDRALLVLAHAAHRQHALEVLTPRGFAARRADPRPRAAADGPPAGEHSRATL